MKIGKLAMAWAIAGLLSGGTLSAQQLGAGPESEARPGCNTRLASSSATSTRSTTRRKQRPPAISRPPASFAETPEKTNFEAAAQEDEGASEPAWEPKHIFDKCCFLKCRGIQVGGWVAQSYVWNPQSPSDHFNGPVTWTTRPIVIS